MCSQRELGAISADKLKKILILSDQLKKCFERMKSDQQKKILNFGSKNVHRKKILISDREFRISDQVTESLSC